jgi:inner membrane protein
VLAVTPLSIIYGAGLVTSPEILLPVIFGSLLPDIDEPGSYIGRKFYFLSGIFRDLGLEHRGFTHFLIIPLVLMMISFLVFEGGWLFWLAFGIFMHSVGDMLTKGGIVSFFYPFGIGAKIGLLPKRFRFKTFSMIEKVFIFFLISLNIAFILKELV